MPAQAQMGVLRRIVLVALLSTLAIAAGSLATPAASAHAAASSSLNVAYVTDFGGGINDGFLGSSIFTQAVTGGPIGSGHTGSYNGANFTDVTVGAIDANPSTALAGFDTVILYELCSIGTHSAALGVINTFLDNGGKVMIFDADRCSADPSGAGPSDYSHFRFPFASSSPGPQGAHGSYTSVEASSLTTGLAVGPVPGDAVGDSNVFTSHAGAWCVSIQGTNVLNASGFIEAYARTVNGGLAIYEGEDVWGTTVHPAPHLKLVFDLMLAQSFNPDGLPCSVPSSGIKLDPSTATNTMGTSHTDTATVVDSDGAPRSGVMATFKIVGGPDSGQTGTGVTDASGKATFTFTDTTAPGTDDVIATFDDNGTTETSNHAMKTWTQIHTSLAVKDAAGDFNDATTITATLTDDNNNGVSGQTVGFKMGAGTGTEACSGTTDGGGVASCSITPFEAAGSYPLAATYAGDVAHVASSATGTFVVTLEETTTKITNSALVGAFGGNTTLSANLTEDGVTPIAGRTLTLTLGSRTCATGATDAAGDASCTLSGLTNGDLGPQTETASFAGDTFYKPSSDTLKVIVFAYLDKGSFVVGDKSAAGGTQTFWGAQWAKLNSLSGGAAPSALKGFADTLKTTPTACGGTWSTDPGNSPPPPSSVPGYMAVIVASQASQSGSTISGDIVHVVVVKVDPGYAGNPGHAGTGPIVGTVC